MQLSDKYTAETGSVYLTGIQALVRLPADQMRRDRRAGLRTGVFISGYEGSPLGGYDLALKSAAGILRPLNVHFQPGVNEDLAATAVMGSQILDTAGKTKVDGVVGIWYGKGPGVDRSGDVFRHANLAGSAGNCAALVLAGDDHVSKSSTIPHQSDFSLMNVAMPFFYPGSTQEVLDYGLLAIALSRFSGAWVGMKMVTDVCDGGGTVELDPGRPHILLPVGYQKRTDVRLVTPVSLALEREAVIRRLDAARQFARLNGVNRLRGPAHARLGLLSAGKPYYDMMQALADLSLGEREIEKLGIRIGKIAMPFPLEAEFVREFARGLDTILVVEEKRSFVELQLRDILYGAPQAPRIFGKSHLPPTGELDPAQIADAIAEVFHLPAPAKPGASLPEIVSGASATPHRPSAFCSGCPHNRSTLVPEGRLAAGGIGCHAMAMRLGDPKRSFALLTQMGGEGAPWIGMRPFVAHNHIFQNIGDGTFFHSGSLAVEACVAAGVNITYKILYNGHVSMTGGQHAEGALPVPELTRKLEAEGVRKTIVLAEDPARYKKLGSLAKNAELRSRDELEAAMLELEQIPGVTALIYDQECAAEKRRARSRGIAPEPVKRLVIHEEVCEGCSDCVTQSNCMSLTPVETPLGQKMRIHQSSCNKDYSCALGDCPSFVTVKVKPGTGWKKRKLPLLPDANVPAPSDVAAIPDGGYRIVAPGIGGTGVVTVNALLATAAWIDGLTVATLDQTGMSQKGGAVVSHLLLSRGRVEAPAKASHGSAALILGFDLLGAASRDILLTAAPGKTVAVVNTGVAPTIDSIRARTPLAGEKSWLEAVDRATSHGRNLFFDASRLAEGLFGTHMAANLFLTGAAYQAGLIPLSLKAIQRAIEWNGVETERNLQVFTWGRMYYHDAAFVEQQLGPRAPGAFKTYNYAEALRTYQSRSYAARYTTFLARLTNPALRETASGYLYKLMAYKDEYEVARLLTSRTFLQSVREMWEAPAKISFNLHPPLLRRFGLRGKIELGPWSRIPLRVLAGLRFLRGTPFDIFGYSAHRRMERSLAGWYEKLLLQVQEHLSDENLPLALEIAALPGQIRGYESIKERSVAEVKALALEKLRAISTPSTEQPSADPVSPSPRS
jgi:indolepyruvate ferredoxin oxidoreductase